MGPKFLEHIVELGFRESMVDGIREGALVLIVACIGIRRRHRPAKEFRKEIRSRGLRIFVYEQKLRAKSA